MVFLGQWGPGRVTQYGYRASHSRHLWGPRPHPATTPHGPSAARALTGAKTDGVTTRTTQHVLALTAATRHNHTISNPTSRSLTPYDH